MTTVAAMADQRQRFYDLVPSLLREHRQLAYVAAEIGRVDVPSELSPRVINVGIREQLAVSVAGGLSLSGLRPIVHTFAPFLIERPYEQVKLDLDHQDVGAVLVSAYASYDWPPGGETHMGRRDVALLDTLSDWTVHVPGHVEEAEALLRQAAVGSGRVYLRLAKEGNRESLIGSAPSDGRMTVLRRGDRGTVIAVGPLADRVVQATEGLDVTMLYAATVRPFDAATLMQTLSEPLVAVVEPYLAGTSDGVVARALQHVPHRVLGLGVHRAELRRYGTVAEHDRAQGLDVAGLRRSLYAFFS